MDKFDNLVRKRCLKLSAGEQLRTGFTTKCQLKNALVKAYKNKSIQQDFGGKTLPNLNTVALSILQPELTRLPISQGLIVGDNYSHRPQALVAQVEPSDAVLAQLLM